MPRIVTFIDTSVLCEILGVPGKSQDHEAITAELRERVATGERLVLPTAAVIETGNHIAQSPGDLRFAVAERFVRLLEASVSDTPPFLLNGSAWDPDLLTLICDGPGAVPSLVEMAAQGVGTGDVSILAEAQRYRESVANVQVGIWTLDQGLAAYG